MKTDIYSLQAPSNYPKDSTCLEVVWKNIFIPFDVIHGLDGCPPDNHDYENFKKEHWWVCSRTKHDVCNTHDILIFMDLPNSKEFKNLDDAIEYCIKWRENWLREELAKTN